MQIRLLALSLFMAASTAGCGGDKELGPELEDFQSGGFAGFRCPPASEADGTCSDPDCGVGCVANTPCNPSKDTCPLGTKCDGSLDEPYCMPNSICVTIDQCASGESCVSGGMSSSICVLVDVTPTACESFEDCSWPLDCNDGFCKLFCHDDQCPTGTTCVENRCEPG